MKTTKTISNILLILALFAPYAHATETLNHKSEEPEINCDYRRERRCPIK